MSISVTKKKTQSRKTVIVYLAVSVFTILVDKVYSLFGHGVKSGFMTWMFLYPLIGGALIYFLIWLLAPDLEHVPGYRLFYNLYNSGIAVLTIGSLFKGILIIAGTDSPFAVMYYFIGILFILTGWISFLSYALKQSKYKSSDR